MSLFAAIVMLLGAGTFNVQTLPLSTANAHVFLSHVDADATADVFVLAGNTLTAYPNAGAGSPLVTVLSEGTSVFDVCDVNQDGRAEIIGIRGDTVSQYVFQDTPQPEHVLFKAETLFSDMSSPPAAHVLVIRLNQRVLFALPRIDALELRALDGTVVASYPMGPDTPHRVSYGSPFDAWTVYPPHIGAGDAIERKVSEFVDFEPDYADDALPIKVHSASRRQASVARAQSGVEGQNSAAWPWFPLKTDGTTLERVLYAQAGPDYLNTVLRIRESKSARPDVREADIVVGPERRYAGTIIVLEEDLPDFNHDGFVDALLWRTPDPGITTDSLTRTLVNQSWPVTLTVHLFSKEKRRFEPQPAAKVTCDIPIAWFLSAGIEGPVRHCVLRDFDGDGRSDLGCATAPTRYCAWLFTDTGFGQQPDFSFDSGDEIQSIDFRADLDGRGRTGLGLRTATALHVFRFSEGNASAVP